jgi:hypothetical protein
MEKIHYDEITDTLGIETIYDATATIEQNKAQKASGRVFFGSKGQQMLHVASIHPAHFTALRNKGYNLLSADPDESRRALLYIQANEPVWMTVEGKPVADFRQKWL